MRKLLVGALTLLALFFAAANARLAERLRVQEGRLSVAEARPRPRPVEVAPTPARPSDPPATPAPAPPPAPSTMLLDRAQAVVARAVGAVDGVLGNLRTKCLVLHRKPFEEELPGLPDSQKRAIEDLKR